MWQNVRFLDLDENVHVVSCCFSLWTSPGESSPVAVPLLLLLLQPHLDTVTKTITAACVWNRQTQQRVEKINSGMTLFLSRSWILMFFLSCPLYTRRQPSLALEKWSGPSTLITMPPRRVRLRACWMWPCSWPTRPSWRPSSTSGLSTDSTSLSLSCCLCPSHYKSLWGCCSSSSASDFKFLHLNSSSLCHFAHIIVQRRSLVRWCSAVRFEWRR